MKTVHLLETAFPKITSSVSLLNINQPGVIAMAAEAVQHHPVLVQLPSVFALLAAPTSEGARQLDDCKMRLEGKNYGTAIGNMQHFLAQALPGSLPLQFNKDAHFSQLTGSFVRLPFRNKNFNSKTIRSGTHQGLLLDGHFRELFTEIEKRCSRFEPDEIWEGKNYNAPLCTSCNISGHPAGSITTLDKAMDFARQRHLPFIVTAHAPAAEKGSYPIFGFTENGVRIHREGPGLERFKQKIPAALRRW